MNLFKHIPLIEISPGVKKSFDGVFEEMYIPLCHFSVSIVKDKSIAEDVVQSVFLKLWQERKKLRKLKNAKSYIYNCVRNASIDWLRKEKRISDVPIDVIQKENIESRIIEQEVRVELNKLLSLLPKKCKKVFVLCVIEKLPYEGVARELGISLNTVKSQRARAIEILRKKYKY